MNLIVIYFALIAIIILGFMILIAFVPKALAKTCKSKVCLVGKTAVVTGGSFGIGYEIVLGLAQRGCRVIVADKIVNNDIKNRIIQETNSTEIYLEYVDLASFHSVRSFADRLKKKEEKVDILIHNAGIGPCSGAISEDGLNITMQVNYYSPFLLTHLLVGLMKSSQSARLIFCSSLIVSAFLNIFIIGRKLEQVFGDYKLSKFCLLVASDIFAEKLRQYNITSNAFHPGAVHTQIHYQFFKHNFFTICNKILGPLIFKTPEVGAQTAIYLACANEVQNITGTFFGDLMPACKPKDISNKTLCETIWKGSEKVVKLKKDELLL
ncbi:retinol dehydrogenase 13-like isoform X1 [Diorhabda sublineata]|uniref:retinol dehydrogenase 13-like isoform X1 n=1 Tax=Diorhabda sublineata TaxID=1163346 RepID=UPI0024E117C9|nr:retinol dehydrogenase 13-like isoform X1 [Diorhabda sublineata]